jgi:hypothetical protein
MTTMRIELERKRVGAVIVIVMFSLMAVLAVYGVLVAGGSLPGRLAFGLILFAAMLWLLTEMIGNFRVYFTDAGVHRPSLLGRSEVFIAWTEVDRVKMSTIAPTLYAGRKRISIQLQSFRDPSAVWKLLGERLSHLGVS